MDQVKSLPPFIHGMIGLSCVAGIAIALLSVVMIGSPSRTLLLTTF